MQCDDARDAVAPGLDGEGPRRIATEPGAGKHGSHIGRDVLCPLDMQSYILDMGGQIRAAHCPAGTAAGMPARWPAQTDDEIATPYELQGKGAFLSSKAVRIRQQ